MRALLGEGRGRQVWAHPQWPQSEMQRQLSVLTLQPGYVPRGATGTVRHPGPAPGSCCLSSTWAGSEGLCQGCLQGQGLCVASSPQLAGA